MALSLRERQPPSGVDLPMIDPSKSTRREGMEGRCRYDEEIGGVFGILLRAHSLEALKERAVRLPGRRSREVDLEVGVRIGAVALTSIGSGPGYRLIQDRNRSDQIRGRKRWRSGARRRHRAGRREIKDEPFPRRYLAPRAPSLANPLATTGSPSQP